MSICWIYKDQKTELIKIKDGISCDNFGLGNDNLHGQKVIQNNDTCQFTYSKNGDTNPIKVKGRIRINDKGLMTCVHNLKS